MRRVIVGIVLAMAAVMGYGFLIEPRWLETTYLPVEMPGLDRQHDGLRIVQLSDLHVGRFFGPDHIASAVTIANSLDPDLVVITGDFISQTADNLQPCLTALQPLRARLGVYAVLGNHEYFANVNLTAPAIEASHITLLRNEAVPIGDPAAGLWLVGVDDMWFDQHDLPAAMRAVPPGANTVVLCHNPDIAPRAAELGANLVLTGHTHGGQVAPPFIGPIVVPNERTDYATGRYQVGATTLYVNRGVGAVTPPIRLGARPEVTLITLKAAP